MDYRPGLEEKAIASGAIKCYVEDLRSVSFSDIWGGFDDALLEASQRYDVNSILVGRFRPGTSQRNQWRYYFSGQERTWVGEPELAVSLVADELAAEFAISGSAPLEPVTLTIAGIDTVAAYGAVQALLKELTIVEDHRITEVAGDRVMFRVEGLVIGVLGWLMGIPAGYALARLILWVFERRFDAAFRFQFPLWTVAVALELRGLPIGTLAALVLGVAGAHRLQIERLLRRAGTVQPGRVGELFRLRFGYGKAG